MGGLDPLRYREPRDRVSRTPEVGMIDDDPQFGRIEVFEGILDIGALRTAVGQGDLGDRRFDRLPRGARPRPHSSAVAPERAEERDALTSPLQLGDDIGKRAITDSPETIDQ